MSRVALKALPKQERSKLRFQGSVRPPPGLLSGRLQLKMSIFVDLRQPSQLYSCRGSPISRRRGQDGETISNPDLQLHDAERAAGHGYPVLCDDLSDFE